MKRFSTIISLILMLSMLLTACGTGGGESTTETPTTSEEVTTAPTETTTPPETTTPVNTEPRSNALVENPGWGYKAYSVSVSDPSIVSAELDKASGNVTVTSYNPGEAEVYVHDCFDHKAIIKVSVADDADCTITYEASPCTEEYIDAADFGVLPGTTASGLIDYTAQMQKAIDHAHGQGGGTVYLYPGFYNIRVISMREGVTLKMYSGFTDAREGYTDELAEKVKNGQVTVLILARILSTNYNDYGRNSAKNFTISGGVIDNDHNEQSTLLFGLSDNITIENMIFKDIRNNHVIQITGSDNVTIRNCIFAGFEWGGTFTRETIQIEQSHPGAHSSNHAGAPQRFDYGEIYTCENVVIDSCYFGPSDELPGAHIAIGHHGTADDPVCDGFKIINNVFDRPTYSAIRFASLRDVEITGNTFIATSDANKFCTETEPAFIILYPNTSTLTYVNIVDGKKVTYCRSDEQPGMHNVNISNNEFFVEKGSDKKIITITGTTYNPGGTFQSNILRQETYNSTPYLLTGYFKSTNYFSNIDFCNNTITYEGQPAFDDFIYKLYRIFGYRFENNKIELNGSTFKRNAEGISGLYMQGCYTGEKAETYTFKSSAVKNYISIRQPDGAETKMIFLTSDSHKIIASEGGRIELESDLNGNIIVNIIPNEGYTFSGWYNADGSVFNKTGNTKITSAITLTAKFTKN